MDPTLDSNEINQLVDPAEWETFRRCRFVQKAFSPYPCLALRHSLSEDGGAFRMPYRDEPFDPAVYELVESGWDHEHCDVCRVRITGGDVYWTSDGPEHVDVCVGCYPRVLPRLAPSG